MKIYESKFYRTYTLYENEIELWELTNGLLVRQSGEAYVAKRWRINSNTDELVNKAVHCGFSWMIRDGHPRAVNRWPHGDGTVYLAFSPLNTCQWAIAIDSVNAKGDDFGIAVFNGKYRSQFEHLGIQYRFKPRNTPHGDLIVKRENVFSTIEKIANADHSVLDF